MNKITIQLYKSPVGELIIGSFEEKLCLCDWRYRKRRNAIDQRIKKGIQAEYIEAKKPIIDQTIMQLQEYFEGKRNVFEIPLLFVGTNFQKAVWHQLVKIPYGKTESYLGLSKKMNNPDAVRAVAAANGANAISIIVPCHRIIGSKGDLIGYAGGLTTKKKLLNLERSSEMPEQLSLFS